MQILILPHTYWVQIRAQRGTKILILISISFYLKQSYQINLLKKSCALFCPEGTYKW